MFCCLLDTATGDLHTDYSRVRRVCMRDSFIIGTRDTTGPGRGWKQNDAISQNHKLGDYKKLGKAAVERMQNATLYELPGLGHMPQFEDYPRFSKVFFPIFE